jgi:hypothetical protein
MPNALIFALISKLQQNEGAPTTETLTRVV